MARKNKMEFEPESEPGMDVSSLIDVSFLLLIYFLVTSTLMPKEGDLGMQLPSDTPSGNPIKLDPMTIKVSDAGQVFVQDELLEDDPGSRNLENLHNTLKSYRETCDATDSDPIVIVAADDQAEHQRFIDVINTLAKVKITNVTLTGFKE